MVDENNLQKKLNRRTTSAQFEKLVDHLEAYPNLAQFGYTKSKSETAWENIAQSLNSMGPPKRTVPEWKKTWSDLRNRTRQNIAEINKCDLYLTEGRFKPLNTLELRVAKLCNFSTAPKPINNNNVFQAKPIFKVADVTLNFSSTLPTTIKSSPSVPKSSPKTVQTIKSKISKQKRQSYIKELELLRKQVIAQEMMGDAMESQVKSVEQHNKSLKEIAEASQLIAGSLSAFVKQLK